MEIHQKGFGALTALVIVAVLAFAGCGGDGDAEQPSAGGGEDIVIGFTSLGFHVPALAEARDGALAKAKELSDRPGVGQVTIKYITADTAEAQLQAVENLLAQQVDAIAIDPNDTEAISPAVAKANAAGVPVVMWVGGAARGDVATTIVSPEKKGGFDIATWTFEKLEGEGQVALLQGDKAHEAGGLREEGFGEAMRDFPGIERVSYGEAEWTRDVGERVAQNFLTRSPSLDAIVALNDEMAHGALAAAKARGVADDLIVTGYNGQCSALASVSEGEMAATLYQPFRDIGAKTVEASVKAVRGEQLPDQIEMPAVVVDEAAIDQIASGTEGDASSGLVASVEVAMNGCS